jgi:two-component system sensor histidine kinase BaeS
MRQTLRWRLIISYSLPLILLVAIIGLGLIYIFNTQLLQPALANELIDQALLIRNLAKPDPGIFQNQQTAQKFLNSIVIHLPTRIDLFDSQNRLLATNNQSYQSQIGKVSGEINWGSYQPQDIRWHILTSSLDNKPTLDAVVPVIDGQGHLVGSIRLSRRLQDISQSLASARLILLVVLAIGLIFSIILSLALAETMSRPLARLSQAMGDAPLEGKADPIPETGFIEIRSLIHSFNRLQERRYQLELARLRMLANLVHELGRPIGSLKAALHSLLSGGEKRANLRHEFLEGMEERINRLERLINDLALSQQKLGPMEIEHARINTSNWLKKLIPLWENNSRSRGINWNVDIPAILPPITGDSNRLSQALSNLVENALKFTPPGGLVCFNVGTSEGSLWIQVIDNGPGISPDDQDRLFEPFYRAIQPPWKAPGLGLGLSIARAIIEAHKGHITIESQPGEGSIFTVYLPLN